MWRTQRQRKKSASERLRLARSLWGWQPHSQQKKLFTSPAQVTVAACGRRWGKTECLSTDIATLALHELAQGRPCRQLVVAPTDAQARLIGGEVWRRLAEALAVGGQEKDNPGSSVLTVRQKPALTLTLTHPALPGLEAAITCRTAGRDGRGLRGLWAHKIIVDEGAYVPDSVLNDVLMPMLLDKGGDYLLASSPNGKRSAYYRLFAKAQSGTTDSFGITYAAFQFPTQANPHLDLAYLRSQREEMGEAMFAQEYEAQFLDVGGNVFREDDIAAALHADPRVSRGASGELLSEPQPGRTYAIGVDWGRRLDFTVVCVLDCTEPIARVVGLWRWQGTGWDTQIKRVAEIIAQFDPWRVWGDGTGIGDTLTDSVQKATAAAVLARDPLARVPRFEQFLFSGGSKQELVDKLNLRLSARTLTYPNHRALLNELRAFEYLAFGASGKPRTGARSGSHDDVVMALGLAVLAAPDAAPPPLASLIMLGSQVGGSRRSAG